MFIEEEITSKRRVYVAPCVKCGSEDINIFDYGYNSPNMGGGECKSCTHSVISNVAALYPTKTELAKIWNASNDKSILIKAAQSIIDTQLKIIKSLS
jgi:hypothetical protein